MEECLVEKEDQILDSSDDEEGVGVSASLNDRDSGDEDISVRQLEVVE